MTDLPSLRDTLDAHGLLAKKSFGQHFLLDLNVTRKIVRLGGPFEGRNVIEVGPGPGGLTRAILESGAGKVILVEKDPRFIPLLSELDDGSGRLSIIEGDALRVREAELSAGPTHLVSNLPYNVGTPLLIKWLTGPWQPHALTLMFQKEVAERVVAQPGEDAYGRLAVIAQAVAEARIIMHLPAAAFTPPPKVASAVVQLVPLAVRPSAERLKKLERVTAAAFGQRRKMLRSSLKQLGGAALCEAAGIEPDARAEVIDIAGFLRLADAL
ncbi:16S rRNA (adenine(1518)-N(6)/adenine(1519)-N(6))-dimethyltransferase RsmA [Brevundimonas vesicularis]|uniref:16S rRNA (adenine(1518)-N(6)/adenine(1519)-N(6))- dimethyltransferase RsmA n=1 Tax=Brevundimonas vesicularis TaxID=41276 RepID=UPI0038D3FA43